ncbi:hypothetical protein VUJ46_08730 [Chryseobacterium sp. MYb264]|uniref:hypothetical protein n=1 Tax=Chryseobacterium sp. MYb264 TaxID=2745153 RepID=UPI002E0EE81B|nr:hypothetical protein VUJ46_08730 [Chryseobacterium sp. MYb264]
MKKAVVLLCAFYTSITYGQSIGIKTPNPRGAFHIDTRGNNPTGTTTLRDLLDDLIIDFNGNLNFTPQNITSGSYGNIYNTKLFVFNSVGDNVRIEGILPAENPEEISLLGANRPAQTLAFLRREKSINEFGIPQPALLTLDADVSDFLNGIGPGGAQDMPMTLVKNAIKGLTYDPATHFLFVPEGLYQFTLIYKANQPGCSVSSYFYDFPFESNFTRVHSNTQHLETSGETATHGGKITYTSQIPAGGKLVRVNLGRGQAGNCTGTGMTLLHDGTQFLIKKIGN